MNCKKDCKHYWICRRYAVNLGVGFGIDTKFNPDICSYFKPRFSLIRAFTSFAHGVRAVLCANRDNNTGEKL